MAQTDITIAGVGGQGSILAGVILGTAVVTYDNKYAAQTQGYSSELRGGYAATWMIISDVPVRFPRVTAPDILVAQAPDAISRFAKTLKPGGLLIIDSDMIPEPPAGIDRVILVPATSISRTDM
jgi:2-oxoglutarate ferredoxin oxidoreductase subunit gamma